MYKNLNQRGSTVFVTFMRVLPNCGTRFSTLLSGHCAKSSCDVSNVFAAMALQRQYGQSEITQSMASKNEGTSSEGGFHAIDVT